MTLTAETKRAIATKIRKSLRNTPAAELQKGTSPRNAHRSKTGSICRVVRMTDKIAITLIGRETTTIITTEDKTTTDLTTSSKIKEEDKIDSLINEILRNL